MKKWFIIILLVIALAAAIFFRLNQLKNLPPELDITLEQKANGIPVSVIETAPETLKNQVAITGTINPLLKVQLNSRVSENIKAIEVQTGQSVLKGQTLITFDDTQAQLALKQALAQQQRAQNQLQKLLNGSRPEEIQIQKAIVQQALASLNLARQEYKRQTQLFDEEASTQQLLDQAKAAFDNAQAQHQLANAQYELAINGPRDEDIAIAQADLELAQVATAQARENLNYHTITAPFDGIITHNRVEIGQMVNAGQNIFDIVDITSVYLDVDISELHITKIAVGQNVKIQIDALAQNPFDGRIAVIDPQGFGLNRAFLTRILIPNPDSLLKPAMFGRAFIISDILENAIALPTDAIRRAINDQGQPQTYILTVDDNNTVQKLIIQTGQTYKDKIHITQGLPAAMKVITLGYGLEVGDKVIIQ